MHQNKPLIVMKRPWWRHPVFPWGWYSIMQDGSRDLGTTFMADGCYRPNDGGGGQFSVQASPIPMESDGGSYCGTVIMPQEGSGKIGIVRQYEDNIKWFGVKDDAG